MCNHWYFLNNTNIIFSLIELFLWPCTDRCINKWFGVVFVDVMQPTGLQYPPVFLLSPWFLQRFQQWFYLRLPMFFMWYIWQCLSITSLSVSVGHIVVIGMPSINYIEMCLKKQSEKEKHRTSNLRLKCLCCGID